MSTSNVTRKSFECDECEAVYSNKQRLNEHKRRVHKGISKRYECTVCNDTFSSPFNRRRHIDITHKQVKSHSCDVCHASFSTKWNMQLHKRQHHDDAPLFKCRKCEKSIKLAHHLCQHERTCKMEKDDRYTCADCDVTFISKANLHRHRLQVHLSSLTILHVLSC